MPNHPYFSKEEEKKIKGRIIKMPHHEKIKLIEWLYKLVENHENQEEGMDEDDYGLIHDMIKAGVTFLPGKNVQLPVALLELIRQSFL